MPWKASTSTRKRILKKPNASARRIVPADRREVRAALNVQNVSAEDEAITIEKDFLRPDPLCRSEYPVIDRLLNFAVHESCHAAHVHGTSGSIVDGFSLIAAEIGETGRKRQVA